jgi:hypothetical protein
MTLLRPLLVAALACAAFPAGAQLSNRSISVESGASAVLGAGGPAGATVAVGATVWLDGDLEALARVGWWAGPRPQGRLSDALDLCGTAGLRLSLSPEPLRPQVSAEVGWARLSGPSGAGDRLALGAGVGLEWFAARDVSLAIRGAVRSAGPVASAELLVAAAGYF